jgi:5'-nucleotidase
MMSIVISILSRRRSQKSKYGRVARRASLIEKIRKEDENVLLLDAVIFFKEPLFYGGELEFKLMSMMQYDADDRKSRL